MSKRTFEFKPTYYEWELTDETGQVLHVVNDPYDTMFITDGDESVPFEILVDFCKESLETADQMYEHDMEYNGLLLTNYQRLGKTEMNEAAELMARTLFDYYID